MGAVHGAICMIPPRNSEQQHHSVLTGVCPPLSRIIAVNNSFTPMSTSATLKLCGTPWNAHSYCRYIHARYATWLGYLLKFYNLTNSVTQEAKGSSLHSQQVPILSQTNPIHTPPISLRSILMPSSHIRLGLQSGLFPSGFPTKTLYICLSSPMRATCPAHSIGTDFICLHYHFGTHTLCLNTY
jgi:hypothetical protein